MKSVDFVFMLSGMFIGYFINGSCKYRWFWVIVGLVLIMAYIFISN